MLNDSRFRLPGAARYVSLIVSLIGLTETSRQSSRACKK